MTNSREFMEILSESVVDKTLTSVGCWIYETKNKKSLLRKTLKWHCLYAILVNWYYRPPWICKYYPEELFLLNMQLKNYHKKYKSAYGDADK